MGTVCLGGVLTILRTKFVVTIVCELNKYNIQCVVFSTPSIL